MLGRILLIGSERYHCDIRMDHIHYERWLFSIPIRGHLKIVFISTKIIIHVKVENGSITRVRDNNLNIGRNCQNTKISIHQKSTVFLILTKMFAAEYEKYGDHGGHSRELNESNFRFIMGSLCLMTISFGISAVRVFCCGNNIFMSEKLTLVRKKSSTNYLASRIILNRNNDYSHQVSVWKNEPFGT